MSNERMSNENCNQSLFEFLNISAEDWEKMEGIEESISSAELRPDFGPDFGSDFGPDFGPDFGSDFGMNDPDPFSSEMDGDDGEEAAPKKPKKLKRCSASEERLMLLEHSKMCSSQCSNQCIDLDSSINLNKLLSNETELTKYFERVMEIKNEAWTEYRTEYKDSANRIDEPEEPEESRCDWFRYNEKDEADQNIIQEHEFDKDYRLTKEDWICIYKERERIKNIMKHGEKKYGTDIESMLPKHLSLSQGELTKIFYFGIRPSPVELPSTLERVQARELASRQLVEKIMAGYTTSASSI